MHGAEQARTVYRRAADVRAYVLARAQGHCEGCKAPAPFKRKDGSPYLETHHLHRVSDGYICPGFFFWFKGDKPGHR